MMNLFRRSRQFKILFTQRYQNFNDFKDIDIKKNYYTYLDVSEKASISEIKQKYYSLAKKYHPDINKGSEEMFKTINEAWGVLGDKEKKQKYDFARQNTRTGSFNQANMGQRYAYQQKTGGAYKGHQSNQQGWQNENPYGSSDQKGGAHQQYKQHFYHKRNQEYQEDFDDYNHEKAQKAFLRQCISGLIVLAGFVLIFEVTVGNLLHSREQVIVYDEDTGASYVTDRQSYDLMMKRRMNKQTHEVTEIKKGDQYPVRRQQVSQKDFDFYGEPVPNQKRVYQTQQQAPQKISQDPFQYQNQTQNRSNQRQQNQQPYPNHQYNLVPPEQQSRQQNRNW